MKNIIDDGFFKDVQIVEKFQSIINHVPLYVFYSLPILVKVRSAIVIFQASLTNIHLPMTLEFPWLIIMQIAISAEWHWKESNVHLLLYSLPKVLSFLYKKEQSRHFVMGIKKHIFDLIKIVFIKQMNLTFFVIEKVVEKPHLQRGKSFISDFWRLVARTVMMLKMYLLSRFSTPLTRPTKPFVTKAKAVFFMKNDCELLIFRWKASNAWTEKWHLFSPKWWSLSHTCVESWIKLSDSFVKNGKS